MSTLGQRVMERAVQRYGEDEVITRLKISKVVLAAYLNGTKQVGDDMLLRAIDLALEHDEARDPGKK